MSCILITDHYEQLFVIIRDFFRSFDEDVTRSSSTSPARVFPPASCRRHAGLIINANTQFLLCALHSAFREQEEKRQRLARESTLGGSDAADERFLFSHVR